MQGLNLGQVDEDMLGLPHLWGRTGYLGLWVDQVNCIEKLSTLVTLITSCVVISTERACSRHESICQESLCFSIIELLNCLFICEVVILVKSVEYVLSDLGLPLGGCATELIKVAVKPVVYLLVNDMVVVTDLLGSLLFFKSLHLGGCAVLVSTADVQSIVAHKSAVASENIGTQHTPDDVTQMGYVIHIRQGTSDKHVSLIGLRKN